jgi:5'-nucleotidase
VPSAPRAFRGFVLSIAVGLSLAPAQTPRGSVDVQLLAFNDFHGNLEPPSGSSGRIGSVEAGGVEYLAAHLARLKAENQRTIVVSAGDNIGASPLLSSLFHDEPTIEALGQAGLQFSAVGNHELDEGWSELYRMQYGGCHPVDGCQDGTPFAGAPFAFLSANITLDPARAEPAALARLARQVRPRRAGPLFLPYAITPVGGVRIGIIGLTLREAPRLVPAAGIAGLTFVDEAAAATEAARALRRRGVRAIVVLIHEGGVPADAGPGGCGALSGALVPIVHALSDTVDVVVSGHTHRAYVCMVGKTLVTSAESFGRIVTRVTLEIDRRTGVVRSKQARNEIVSRDVERPAGQSALLEHYRPFAAAIGGRPVGTIATSILRAANAAGESALGDVIADAMLDASRDPVQGGAAVAFMNTGGIRADLTGALPAAGGLRMVTFADTFNVLPFANRILVKTISGRGLLRLLEQQFDNPVAGRHAMLQPSAGFGYRYDLRRPAGQRIDPGSLTLNQVAVDPEQTYRVAMPDFLWAGGDGFDAALEGRDQGPPNPRVDVDVLAAYLTRRSPVLPGPQDRIVRQP